MPKKTFTFTTPRESAADLEPSAVDLQILRKTVDDGVRQLEGARVIAIDRLRPDPTQPRRDMDGQALEQLAESIRQEGVLQPLLVRYRYEEDDFMIIAGERRYRAALLAGATEVPAVVKNIDGTRRYVLQLMENLQREDLNAVDKGRALDHLKTIMPGNWQQMADLVGLTRRRVEQLRALPRLPVPLQDAVRANRITEDHARTISRLPEPYQEPVLDAVESAGFSTRRTKALVQRVQESLGTEQRVQESLGMEQRVRESLGTEQRQSEIATAMLANDRGNGAAVEGAAEPEVEVSVKGSQERAPSTSTFDQAGAAPAVLTSPLEVVRGVTEALLRSEGARGPRSRLAVPVYERALEFERVLDRMPVLEFQEDRTLLNQIFARIEDKIGRIRGEDL